MLNDFLSHAPLRLPGVAGSSAPLPTALTGRAGKLRRTAWRFRPSLKREVQAQNERTEANRLRMEQQIIEYKKREAIAEDFQLMGGRRDDNRPQQSGAFRAATAATAKRPWQLPGL